MAKKSTKSTKPVEDLCTNHSVGNVVSLTKYARIKDISKDVMAVVDVDDNTEFDIIGKSLIDTVNSSSIFGKIEKVSLTSLAEKVSSVYGRPVSVCFVKQDGEERILVGRLMSAEPVLGRSYYEDLNIHSGEHRLRQVDHRTLKWAIIDNVKYIVK